MPPLLAQRVPELPSTAFAAAQQPDAVDAVVGLFRESRTGASAVADSVTPRSPGSLAAVAPVGAASNAAASTAAPARIDKALPRCFTEPS
jgi:hypothetical protein